MTISPTGWQDPRQAADLAAWNAASRWLRTTATRPGPEPASPLPDTALRAAVAQGRSRTPRSGAGVAGRGVRK